MPSTAPAWETWACSSTGDLTGPEASASPSLNWGRATACFLPAIFTVLRATTVSGVSTLQAMMRQHSISFAVLPHLQQLCQLDRPLTNVVLSGVDHIGVMTPSSPDREWKSVNSWLINIALCRTSTVRPSCQRCCTVRRPGQASARLLTLLVSMHLFAAERNCGEQMQFAAVSFCGELHLEVMEVITLLQQNFLKEFCCSRTLWESWRWLVWTHKH